MCGSLRARRGYDRICVAAVWRGEDLNVFVWHSEGEGRICGYFCGGFNAMGGDEGICVAVVRRWGGCEGICVAILECGEDMRVFVFGSEK